MGGTGKIFVTKRATSKRMEKITQWGALSLSVYTKYIAGIMKMNMSGRTCSMWWENEGTQSS